MAERRFPLRPFAEPSLDRSTIGAHLLARQYETLHDPTLTDAEKVAVLCALAELAHDLAEFWSLTRRHHGAAAERLFYRLAGLTTDGLPHPDLIHRLAVVTAAPDLADDEEHIERGEN